MRHRTENLKNLSLRLCRIEGVEWNQYNWNKFYLKLQQNVYLRSIQLLKESKKSIWIRALYHQHQTCDNGSFPDQVIYLPLAGVFFFHTALKWNYLYKRISAYEAFTMSKIPYLRIYLCNVEFLWYKASSENIFYFKYIYSKLVELIYSY